MENSNTAQATGNSTTGRDGVDVRCLVQHLDLFSGIGGFALAAKWVGRIKTVAFCEIDPWAQKVLAKNFPSVPCHDDVKTLDPNKYGRIDLITAGYPCQPFSVAGKRKGKNDDRHLWPEVFRIIKQARPRWVLCENVVGHVAMGLDQVLSDLESEGYTAEAIIIPACAVDAPHRRDRVWIVAYTSSERRDDGCDYRKKRHFQTDERLAEKNQSEWNGRECGACQASEDAANSSGVRLQGWFQEWQGFGIEALGHEENRGSIPQPTIRRVNDGIPNRVDRTRGLGNAIVPQVAAEILRAMMTTDSLLNDKTEGPAA